MRYEDVLQNGAEALKEICSGINSVIPASERDFLAIGDYLAQFADRARDISEAAVTASHLLGADRIRDIASRLRHVLEGTASRALIAREGLEEKIGMLRQMIGRVDEIAIALTDFSRTLKTLRALGISTRIESSRFRDARFRFESLADDVERSASVIELKYKEMCRRVATLSDAMNKVLHKVLKAGGAQNTNAALILEKLMVSLGNLEGKQASATLAMDALSGRSGDVVRSISDVIMSLQFHDICRQQMEHVGQTVEDLSLSFRQKGGEARLEGEGEDGAGTSCASVYRICGLQLAQLSYTRETIFDAVERITESMNSIAASVDSMVHETRKMLAAADDKNESYLVQLEDGAEAVLALFNDNRRTGDQLAEAILSATQTSSSISESVLAIQDIVDDIKLLSLNARIKAAMAGQEGRSVSVLSEAIERLAGDMNSISDIISQSFSTVLEGASVLERRLEGAGFGSHDGTEPALSGLESIRSESTETNREATGLLARIREEGCRLAASIRSVTGTQITVHRTIGSSLEAVAFLLRRFMDDLRPFVRDDAAEEELSHLEDRYTMESERQIHRAQFAVLPSSLYGQADTLDDNVELF